MTNPKNIFHLNQMHLSPQGMSDVSLINTFAMFLLLPMEVVNVNIHTMSLATTSWDYLAPIK
jgi:hypothetical protein